MLALWVYHPFIEKSQLISLTYATKIPAELTPSEVSRPLVLCSGNPWDRIANQSKNTDEVGWTIDKCLHAEKQFAFFDSASRYVMLKLLTPY